MDYCAAAVSAAAAVARRQWRLQRRLTDSITKLPFQQAQQLIPSMTRYVSFNVVCH